MKRNAVTARHKSRVLLLVCIFFASIVLVSIFVALLLPPQATPEEISFSTHRSDYERVVEMARQHQLKHNNKCVAAFVPPSGYQHLAVDCIYVEDSPVLVVEFTPKDFYKPIVYAQTVDVKAYASACGRDGVIYKKLDENWYLCNRDWN